MLNLSQIVLERWVHDIINVSPINTKSEFCLSALRRILDLYRVLHKSFHVDISKIYVCLCLSVTATFVSRRSLFRLSLSSPWPTFDAQHPRLRLLACKVGGPTSLKTGTLNGSGLLGLYRFITCIAGTQDPGDSTSPILQLFTLDRFPATPSISTPTFSTSQHVSQQPVFFLVPVTMHGPIQ